MSKMKNVLQDRDLTTAVVWLDTEEQIKSRIRGTRNAQERWEYQKMYEGLRWCFEEARQTVEDSQY